MTLLVAAALATCALCAIGRISVLMWFGLSFWVVCAAGAGAVVGAVFGHADIGAICATGGALCCFRFISSLFSSEQRSRRTAAASADARLKFEAALHAAAMADRAAAMADHVEGLANHVEAMANIVDAAADDVALTVQRASAKRIANQPAHVVAASPRRSDLTAV